MADIPYSKTVEEALRDSGLFTQVEPDWLADHEGRVTFVNKSRGVIARVDRRESKYGNHLLTRIFYDRGDSTYTSSGSYDVEELNKWWFPVMRSDAAWKAFIETESQDITERALDLV